MYPVSHPTDTPPDSATAFARRARDRLSAAPPAEDDPLVGPSDFDLNPAAPRPTAADAYRAAAVLIPIVARPALTLLLTRRADGLPRHAGQIAFPGGRVDPDDTDACACALREAEEEIGLGRGHVEPLGFLDTYRTGTGFAITPVVALVQPGFILRLDPLEVAEVFEVPFDFVMDPANRQTHTTVWNGAERRYYAMPWGRHMIWGATAGILVRLHQRLFEP